MLLFLTTPAQEAFTLVRSFGLVDFGVEPESGISDESDTRLLAVPPFTRSDAVSRSTLTSGRVLRS
jgi:hypothetical protein